MAALLLTAPRTKYLNAQKIDSRLDALQGAGHAVLRTLYSRAHRVGLNEASCLLRRLFGNVSVDLLLIDVGRMFAEPVFEVGVPLEEEFEGFADDVGRISTNELSVSIEVAPDMFIQAELKGGSFVFFEWCFQQWHVSSSFFSFGL